MRSLRLLLVLALSAVFSQAQDAGMIAAQAAQQANDQAMLAAQLTAQNAQSASDLSTVNQPYGGFYVARPRFSVKPGSYPSAITVRIKDSTPAAVIYYTTDGWTPTQASTRYTGPVTVTSTTHIQAVALIPQLPLARSRIAHALYSLPASQTGVSVLPQANPPATRAAGQPVMARGTPVPLRFASPVTSRTAEVGDKLSLTLAEDLRIGGVLVARKGTPVSATVTEVIKAGMLGRPGEVAFQVDDLQTDGAVIKLSGSAAREGRDKAGTAIALAVIPPGIFAFLEKGKEAEIESGTAFLASVKADTALPSSN